MASIIVSAHQRNNGIDYLNALGLARRTLKHGKSLSPVDEIALKVAKAYHKWLKGNGKANTKETLEEFYTDHCKVRLAKDGNEVTGGYVVLHRELIGLFSNRKGMGDWLVQMAIKDGADHLDCFDGHLPEFYAKHGFRVHDRAANWAPGEPDVVFMNCWSL